MKLLLAVGTIIALAAVGVADDEPGGPATAVKPVRRDAPYQAYWLMAPADGARAEYQRLLVEYQRLLVTRGSVEALAGHKSWSIHPLDNMAMTFRTYRRDSLWDDPFRCVGQFGEVDGKAKTAVVDGTAYLYEPCPLGDVVGLLEKPEGTIPLHRREHPLRGAEQTARAFRLLLQEQMKAEK